MGVLKQFQILNSELKVTYGQAKYQSQRTRPAHFHTPLPQGGRVHGHLSDPFVMEFVHDGDPSWTLKEAGIIRCTIV